MGHRWGFAEDTVRLAAALRPALAARGVPDYVYVDNGSAFVDSWLMRACARLGIKLVHSAPGRPQGRGKIERFFRTVNGEFTVEIAAGDGKPGRQVSDLAEMNRLFTAWVENVYHRRVHSETGMAPLARWMAGAPFPVPSARRPGRRVPLGRVADRRQDRPGVPALQPLPGRPRPGRVQGRAGLRPVRPVVPAGPPRRARTRAPPAVPGHPPLPPQGPPRGPGRSARPRDRHRLPRPDRRPPYRRARRQGQLLRPSQPPRPPNPAPPARSSRDDPPLPPPPAARRSPPSSPG